MISINPMSIELTNGLEVSKMSNVMFIGAFLFVIGTICVALSDRHH